MKQFALGLLIGVLAIIAVWFHYRYTANRIAITVGWSATMYVAPMLITAALVGLFYSVGLLRGPRAWISFITAAALSYLPLALFIFGGDG
jgi:hypothetical protein